MIWATVSSSSCFYWLYRASPFLAAKNIINLISVLTIWWCPCVEFSICLHFLPLDITFASMKYTNLKYTFVALDKCDSASQQNIKRSNTQNVSSCFFRSQSQPNLMFSHLVKIIFWKICLICCNRKLTKYKRLLERLIFPLNVWDF